MEWIIIDDSDNNIELLPKRLQNNPNIKHIKLDERTSIGQKRNIAVENCSNEFIICMDDDDYYPPNSIRERVGAMIKYKKLCS